MNKQYQQILNSARQDQERFVLEHPELSEALMKYGEHTCSRAYELFEKYNSVVRVSKELDVSVSDCAGMITAFGQLLMGQALAN